MSKAIFKLPIPIILILIGIMMLNEELERIRFEGDYLINSVRKEFDA